MKNPVAWFEIPVLDMDRAIKFYNEVFDFKLEYHDLGELLMAQLPFDVKAHGSSGALVCNKNYYIPSKNEGVLIYFECKSVKETLIKVNSNGGQILVEEKEISPEHGFMGVFVDTEGNRIALHSNPG